MAPWDSQEDDPWKKWRDVFRMFDFEVTNHGIKRSDNKEVLSEQANMPKAARQVGETIEAGYEAQKNVLTLAPGGDLFYNAIEAKIGRQSDREAWENTAIDATLSLFGGNIGKCTGQAIGDIAKNLGLVDGMKASSSKVLDMAEQFLGRGYRESVPGSGRYISADGTRVFRMDTSDITGKQVDLMLILKF